MKLKSIFARLGVPALVALLPVALAAPVPALAEENDNFVVELGGAFIVPREDIDLGGIDLAGSSLDEYFDLSEGDELEGKISPKATYGFSVLGRYQAADFLALEGGYTTSLANGNLDLQMSEDRTVRDVTIHANSDNIGGYEVHALSAGARVEYRPGPAAFFARAGVGLWRIDYNVLFLDFSEEGEGVYFGGGAEYGPLGVGWTRWMEVDIFNVSYNHVF